MIDRSQWLLKRLFRRIWVRSSAYALLGIAAALVARPLSPLIPTSLESWIGAAAVDRMLGILASSLLAVVIFSLSITVSSFAAAAGNSTPRAIRLLQEDRTTQNVLATFLGGFLFSLVGIIALQSGLYEDAGRFVLFVATIVVVALIVIALLRWISHLMEFGRMSDILARVERATAAALKARAKSPYLGGSAMREPPPANARPLFARTTGYVQHVDMPQLAACAEEMEADFWVAALPGTFVHPGAPLLSWSAEGSDCEEHEERLRGAFTCDDMRSFDQDPRFGLIILSEIASRALSPAVNDPGTAIDVIGRFVRVLLLWRENKEAELAFPRVRVPPLSVVDMLEDAFQPIARDGAGVIEVQIRLQKALAALVKTQPETFASAAVAMSREATERARRALALPSETARVEALEAELAQVASAAR